MVDLQALMPDQDFAKRDFMRFLAEGQQKHGPRSLMAVAYAIEMTDPNYERAVRQNALAVARVVRDVFDYFEATNQWEVWE